MIEEMLVEARHAELYAAGPARRFRDEHAQHARVARLGALLGAARAKLAGCSAADRPAPSYAREPR